MTLSEEQKQAVRMAATHRLLILTGGPGVGKSFTCRTIVALWKAMGKTVVLASPTGRAAQRLSELTISQSLMSQAMTLVAYGRLENLIY